MVDGRIGSWGQLPRGVGHFGFNLQHSAGWHVNEKGNERCWTLEVETIERPLNQQSWTLPEFGLPKPAATILSSQFPIGGALWYDLELYFAPPPLPPSTRQTIYHPTRYSTPYTYTLPTSVKTPPPISRFNSHCIP